MTAHASPGKITLVGLGPGNLADLTGRARAALAEADTVIGYVTYIRQIKDLLEGKTVIKRAMTEELDRAIEAYERARRGEKVAIVSSGDAGVYGMAGPTYEVLFQAGWTPDSEIAVDIVPGASAINTCAALAGAPLTHDSFFGVCQPLTLPIHIIPHAAIRPMPVQHARQHEHQVRQAVEITARRRAACNRRWT